MTNFISHRGVNWHYTLMGQGPTLLFIHGFGGSSAWWFNQIDFLKADFQLLLIDLPGHGQSSFKPLTPIEIANELRQLLVSLHISELSIVSCSMGGLFAIELQRQIPDAIMRMSFVGSIPKFARSDNYPAGLDIDKIRTLSGQFDGNYQSILDIFFRSLFTMKERDSESFKSIKSMRATEALPSREALKHYLNILEQHDARDRLSGMICPLQFITGREDYICPQAIMNWVAEHAYNARFDVMDGCGHLPMMTEVSEYNRLLEDFLLS